MDKLWKRFLDNESGAVTIDWVVLSAAIIGMGMLVLGPVAFSANSSAEGVGTYVAEVPIGYANN